MSISSAMRVLNAHNLNRFDRCPPFFFVIERLSLGLHLEQETVRLLHVDGELAFQVSLHLVAPFRARRGGPEVREGFGCRQTVHSNLQLLCHVRPETLSTLRVVLKRFLELLVRYSQLHSFLSGSSARRYGRYLLGNISAGLLQADKGGVRQPGGGSVSRMMCIRPSPPA